MASRKPFKKSDDSEKQKHYDKNKSQKQAYQKKNYKSSPALSSSSMEKVVLFECSASSRSVHTTDDDSAINSFTKSVKGRRYDGPHSSNVARHNEMHTAPPMQRMGGMHIDTIKKNSPPFKYEQKSSNVSRIESPLYMSETSQSQFQTNRCVKPKEPPERNKYNTKSSNNEATQFTNINCQKSKSNFKNPDFQQNTCHRGRGNYRFTKGNVYQDKFVGNVTNPFTSNPPAIVTATQFHENHHFDAKSKYQKPGENFENPNNCQSLRGRGRGRGNDGFSREKVTHRMIASDMRTGPLMSNAASDTDQKMPTQFPRKIKFNTQIYDPNSKSPDIKKHLSSQIKYQKKKSETKSSSSNYKKKSKVHSRRRNIKEDNSKIIEKEISCNTEPLLSIQCVNVTSQENDLIQFSDEDEDGSIASDYSVNSTFNLIDFSNDVTEKCQPSTEPSPSLIDLSDVSVVDNAILSNTDSDSTDESEETNEASEVSSSVFSSESRMNIFSSGITKEAYVSVFWDIENCSLPSNKSAIEFANYVRNTFYEGRTEVQFTAACDVSKLNSILVREIDEAAITLIHINAINKNAADKKIQSLLQRFQLQYRMTNSAIVLISSDSDFSQYLLDMRYQHHIFVNLVCRSETRDSLKTAANKYVLFDDIMEELPDRVSKNDVQHILVIENLPKMSCKLIKNSLLEKLVSFNCRIKVNMINAKIVFQDYSVCNKAMNALKGFYLGGNALKISYRKDLKEMESSEKKKKKEDKLLSLDTNIKEPGIPKNMTNIPLDQDLTASHGASLSIVVSSYLGNVEYWKKFFENIWKTSDFSIHWEGSILDGYLLVDFKSLKKAQKIKKVLMKNQMNDPNAPKFLKLIKYGEDLGNLRESLSIIDPKKKKIEESILIIEKKKSKLLKKHESMMIEKNNPRVHEMHGVSEATLDKLKGCKEQMHTFKTFSDNAINIVKTLYNSHDIESKVREVLCDFTRECNCFSLALPIYAKKDNILKAIRNNQVTIIKAETGSGKSTQLTQYIWRDKIDCKNGMIICTQPRKIAAISLAKFVSTQVGCKLGDIVGYKVGMSSKLSTNTKILYVTDFTMLKMLISEDLNSVSCIIIDEAHERTIYTDILIAMIKQHLPSYPHLKIVITSATIDTSIFKNYFALTDNSVLHVSGRTFPIEDIWLDFDITPEWDYFATTINKALEILNEEPGNVLLFLTTPLETEKACDLFSKKLKGKKDENKIKTFYLHGKMNSEEQQKIFEKTASDIRKVIFATNCAETSITIPGVKYVVDCGLVKECQYDATRNMNVLAVGLVSKSSAEQRRGRAGRTQTGKCFRLYSKNNYDKMVNSTDPEILRINLGQALLKLLKMGIKNPNQFDFLQSPPREQLTYAMNQLIHLKAIEENTCTLTDLGNKMAVMPLEPRLCHLIFQGFDCNIGYDSLVVAALVTMSHALFFRSSENKEEADRKKRRFCDSESDYITYLEVYKEWVDVPKNSKSQWCVINCINARSMRIVQELVSEIILILQKELQIKVNLKFNSASSDALLNLIFNSFSQNLSVYSGHPKFGYRCLNMPDQLLVHPSSSLYSFERTTPQFVVYDTVLKTSRSFMMNISPVTKDMIKEAVQSNRLAIDLKAFDNLIGTELCINDLGEKLIINYFIGKKGMKRKEIQNKLKESIGSELIEIDVDVSKGCVKIFCFDNKLEGIKSQVFPIVNNAKNTLLNAVKDIELYEERSFTAIMKAGGVIEDVVLPGEFRDLKIFLKEQGDIDTVLEKLSSCGDITGTREWKKYFKVSFQTPVSAKKALDTFDKENDFSLQKIIKYPNEGCDMYKVHMTFIRRPCEGIAYITLDNPLALVGLQLPTYVQFNDTLVSLSISKKTGDIRVVKLPLNADQNTLRTVASSLLPPDVKIKKCIITRKKPYESTKEELDLIKDKVLSLFAEFTYKENIEVHLRDPLAKDFTWNATIFIKNSRDGETAVNVLKSRKHVTHFLGGFTLKPNLQTSLYCKSEIFSVVKDEILASIEDFKKIQPPGNELSLNVIPKGQNNVEIKIVSNNVSDMTTVRSLLHGIIGGDTLNFFHSSSKEKFFSHIGKEFMNELTKMYQDCFIYQNNYKKTVTIFGKESSINIIKSSINNFLINLEHEDCKDISLKTEYGKSIFKELLKMYGYDLLKLKEECNISDIKFDKFKQILTVQGNSSSVLQIESVIQDMKKKIESLNIKVNGEVCPVCYDEISEDKHRLEYCGHLYCSECLLHLFQSSEDIPLKCGVCGDPIVLEDIFWAVNEKKPLEKALFEKFLFSFVSNRKDISYCPSPNCNMIFRITEESNIFKCPLCGNSICTHCEVPYHYGMSCSLYKCIKSDDDYSLKAWMKENAENRKLCPSCKSPIEKNGGCNHMTCWKCKSHMCWLCLKVCSTGGEVYNHLGFCPMLPRS